MPNQDKNIKRSKEILTSYFAFLDQHIDNVVQGRVPEFMELNQIARELAVSHQHLSDTIQQETGHHPCHFYDEKIIDQAKKLLKETEVPIAQVAMQLTYDPSNFSKFFKKWTGQTPGNFRKSISDQ
ncbi:helix-turn-helix domain-containing protein [Elizabethkingia anophelis]|uniref:helix-turn-helix domain-containing protein n=1 Tax=Elizabethkingia anophelis TaxID=1117645 RepID=UPI000442C65A|nr:AraC family transcriptional regulator [Elizabethkingia anophelis]MCT3923435.1 helix-turn-helix transcriptional regulator [Elizabethkingia anophelis]MCT4062168.1 helix-turn-helix transcriptional regulator [Elizabethkingia anophelis]MCT4108459.1 helix-turn-helix transcriptional regulator [Elizabethkingia anophelis]CDN75774.1 Transcriptional regulator, arac family protein [Elizabethkingia anophelis]CDN76776.1 Transcriptional regulator, arac family protein [Elizabethkingia anophelis]